MFKSLSASKEIYTAFQDRYNDYHFVQDTHGIVLEITIDNGRENQQKSQCDTVVHFKSPSQPFVTDQSQECSGSFF